MEEKPAISDTSSQVLPRWLTKTHSRYDADDMAFTPPSEDGDTFFSLRIDNSSTHSAAAAHKSTFDKINEELGLSEIPGEPRLGLTPRTNSGLCLTTELHDERIERQSRVDQQPPPLPAFASGLVRSSEFAQHTETHATDVSSTEITGYNTGSNSYNPITAAAKKLIELQQSQNTSVEDDDLIFDLNETDIVTPLRERHFHWTPYRDDKDRKKDQQHLDPLGDKQEFLGLVNRLKNIIPRTAGPSPSSSPKPLRKTSVPGTPFETHLANAQPQPSSGDYFSTGGVVVNRNNKMPSYNNFFYRDVETDTTTSSAAVTPASSAVATSAGSDAQQQAPAGGALQQQQAAMASAAAAATTATLPLKERRLRPKPSRLREMNFWAPTSM